MPAAGWYVDPDAQDRLRWWDGQSWNAWVSAQGRTWAEPMRGQPPLTAAGPAPLPYPQPHPYPQPQPFPPAQPHVQAPSYLGQVAPPPYPTAPSPVAPPEGYVWNAGGGPAGGFRSLKGLSVALLVLFIVAAIAYAVVSLTLFNRADTFTRADTGFVPAQEVTDADDAVAGAYAMAAAAELAIFVLLIIWLWRAYSNTRVFGAGPWRWGRGWTIGSWFIPLANFVIPKLLINDAWRGADGRAPGNPNWRRLPVSGVVTMWWVLFVFGRVALQISDTAASVPDDIGDVVPFDQFGGVVALVCLAGSILGAIAVWKLFRRQHDRARELGLTTTA